MTVLAPGLATVLAAGIVVGCVTNPSSPPSVEPTAVTFPATVGELNVMSVERAVALLESGGLDGRVVAVAGYYGSFQPSCPAPGGYIGPLERWCSFDVLAATREAARLCQPEGTNGMSCHGATGENLAPVFVSETSGVPSMRLTGEPAAVVLIGHAGDPRQWQCTSTTQDSCSKAFVVDRIAWVDGRDVPMAAPETGEHASGAPIVPTKTLAQVLTGIGLGNETMTGAPFRAGDIATLDPRWNLAGDDVVWLIRSLAKQPPSSAEEPRAETVWLVDDETGAVIDSQPLQLDASYAPARVWPIAIVHGLECCGTDLFAFVHIETSDGKTVYDGMVSGGARGSSADEPSSTTFGGGYGSLPLVLPAGGYTIHSGLALLQAGVPGPQTRGCSSEIVLKPLDELALNAEFPVDGACTFDSMPFPTGQAGA